MYKATSSHQITFHDFNQSCGMQLDMGNGWCRLAHAIDWAAAEELYARNFPSRKGHPAFPVRMALGALIIQKRTGLSDRALVRAVAENPYFQYFIGMESFTGGCPFTYSTLAGFRKRLTHDVLMEINESFLATAEPTPEHGGGKTRAKREEAKARMLVEQLYRYFCENPDKMPEFYYKNTANDSVGRCVCDYISGMTDRYAVDLYKDLFIPKEWETPASHAGVSGT